jgi:hypothetical protein
MRHLALLLLFASVLGAAVDPRLTAIHELLVPMRTAPYAQTTRGATPALTTVKHQLREWIESRFDTLQWDGWQVRWIPDPSVLEEQLNDELSRADLFFPTKPPVWDDPLGYLGRVRLELQHGFLVLRTTVRVQGCGDDDSAYIYEFANDRWRGIWQSEQTDYQEKKYLPQRLVEVRISPTDWHPDADKTEHLIVTVGVFPWCSSVWQPVYYRVWQAKSTFSSPLFLLDGSELVDINGPNHARASGNDVFIEYHVIASDAMRVPELRHYILEDGKLRRTDPVALTPQDFVSFWLRRPWSEVSEWTAASARATLKAVHEGYKGNNSEFASPTRRCTRHPDLWQVSGYPSEAAHTDDVDYFLIRARPPFRFTMVGASTRPWPDCTEGDPAIDAAPGLFDE